VGAIGQPTWLYAGWAPLKWVAFSCLLDPSNLVTRLHTIFGPTCRSPLPLFLFNPWKTQIYQNLWNSVSETPNSMLEIDIYLFSCFVDGLY
jgi:hypothetical protein